MIVVYILIALVEAVALAAGIYFGLSRMKSGSSNITGKLLAETEERRQLVDQMSACIEQLAPIQDVRIIVGQIFVVQEALRAERGRTTISQAELETVEGRLRELEEIERELEASGIETQEELKILQKKEAELKAKNQALQAQISDSLSKLDVLMGEVEFSAQAQEHMANMKSELLRTEQQVETIIVQMEESNEQYFTMKKRYDALDIEYAQLYERFTETEAANAPKA
jgi:chromosome segregation ATPase